MQVWLVEHDVEWSSTTVLGIYKNQDDALDAALAAARALTSWPSGDPKIQTNEMTGAVTYTVGANHYTAMPMEVQ